jgi:hypothetical protein
MSDNLNEYLQYRLEAGGLIEWKIQIVTEAAVVSSVRN